MSAARRVSLAAACAVVMLAGGLARAETVAASLTSTPGNGNRLVLDLMPPNGWAVQQFEDLIEVRFPGVAADIALPTALRPLLAEVSTERRDGETFCASS